MEKDNYNERENPDHDIDELPKQQELDINDTPQVDFEDHHSSDRPITADLQI